MANLDQIHSAIASFSLDDFPQEFFRLPKKSDTDAFQRAVKYGKQHKVPNPYDNKCYAYSEAFHVHLGALNIPNILVSSDFHVFILIPVNLGAVTEFYFFDPTIQQFYPKHQDPVFLGSLTALETLNKALPLPNRSSAITFHEIYFQNLHVLENGGFVCEKGHMPSIAEKMFPPEMIRLLNGTETQHQQRMKRLQDFRFTPEHEREELEKLARLEKIRSDLRDTIRSRLHKQILNTSSTQSDGRIAQSQSSILSNFRDCAKIIMEKSHKLLKSTSNFSSKLIPRSFHKGNYNTLPRSKDVETTDLKKSLQRNPQSKNSFKALTV